MHQIDLSRLQRRKPNLNVCALRYTWHSSNSGWEGSYIHSHWCLDPRKYDLGHRGQIVITRCGDEKYVCELRTLTEWDDGWDSQPSTICRIDIPATNKSVDQIKHEAELLYNQHLVPLLLNYSGEAEYALAEKFKGD